VWFGSRAPRPAPMPHSAAFVGHRRPVIGGRLTVDALMPAAPQVGIEMLL
jgi:hypothetical protein